MCHWIERNLYGADCGRTCGVCLNPPFQYSYSNGPHVRARTNCVSLVVPNAYVNFGHGGKTAKAFVRADLFNQFLRSLRQNTYWGDFSEQRKPTRKKLYQMPRFFVGTVTFRSTEIRRGLSVEHPSTMIIVNSLGWLIVRSRPKLSQPINFYNQYIYNLIWTHASQFWGSSSILC